MKVTLICPAMGDQLKGRSKIGTWKMQPLSLAVLAGLTPPDWEVSVVDDRVEAVPFDSPTDLVGVSIESFTARRGYQIADEYRKRGVPVVVGGCHITLNHEEASAHADAVVLGEAEQTWPKLLEDFRAGQLQPVYRAAGRAPLEDLRPRREVFAGKRYLGLDLVESSRGCVFNCSFCTVTAFFERTFERRPCHDVVAEIERLDSKLVFLVDDNFTADLESAKDLCRALIPLRITWVTQASITMASDPELLDLMARSGCAGVLIGFESLATQSLEQIDKGWNVRACSYSEAIKRIYDHGIGIYATFVLGLDQDTAETLEATLEFALEHRFFLAGFNRLQPYPGTPLYTKLEQEGRLIYPRWWLDPSYRFGEVVYHPAQMTAAELAERCESLRRRFYSLRGITQRALNLRTNCSSLTRLSAFLIQNVVARKELSQKSKMRLGA